MRAYLADEQQSLQFAKQLARAIDAPCAIYLSGDLGTGKTTLVRAFLQAKGIQGSIKSPTFSMIEPYSHQGCDYFHFDLYRLADPEELEFMGIRDYFDKSSIIFVEWPQKAQSILPSPDIFFNLHLSVPGRLLEASVQTARGAQLQNALQALFNQYEDSTAS